MKVLIAEDELVISMAYEYYLKSKGCCVLETVVSGKEAVDVAKKENPELILLDIQLVGECDGFKVANEIRKFSQAKIVFISGNAHSKMLEESKNISNSTILTKPVEAKDLEQLMCPN